MYFARYELEILDLPPDETRKAIEEQIKKEQDLARKITASFTHKSANWMLKKIGYAPESYVLSLKQVTPNKLEYTIYTGLSFGQDLFDKAVSILHDLGRIKITRMTAEGIPFEVK
jgi:hypothetical protein